MATNNWDRLTKAQTRLEEVRGFDALDALDRVRRGLCDHHEQPGLRDHLWELQTRVRRLTNGTPDAAALNEIQELASALDLELADHLEALECLTEWLSRVAEAAVLDEDEEDDV